VFSEVLNKEQVVLASFFLELFEESVVGNDSLLSGVDVILGFLDFIVEIDNVSFDIVYVLGSVGEDGNGFVDLFVDPFFFFGASGIGLDLFLLNVGTEIS
jgi:hypothetical protein